MLNTRTTAMKLVLGLAIALALGACSKKNAANLDAGLDAGDSGLSGSEAQVAGSAADFSTNVGDRVFFAVDQTALSEEARGTLSRQAQWLQQYPEVAIQVEGHADERGTREYNISLSARRATAVRNFLISQGISAERISSIAYGKERPSAFCDAEECWSQNRRAVTVITSGARTS